MNLPVLLEKDGLTIRATEVNDGNLDISENDVFIFSEKFRKWIPTSDFTNVISSDSLDNPNNYYSTKDFQELAEESKLEWEGLGVLTSPNFE